jgi:cell division protein FtsB
MATRRTRASSTPGPGRGRTGRRPAAKTPSTRRTTRSTSALPPEPVAVATRSKLTGRAAILLLVLAVLAVSYASSARAWLNQRSENNGLRAQIAEQEAAVAQLKQDKRRWSDDDFIKMQARLRFGWVLPGEVGYRVIGVDGEVLAGGSATLTKPSAPAANQDPEWWDAAWGSMEAAGKTPEQLAADAEAQQTSREHVNRIGGGSKSKQPSSRP